MLTETRQEEIVNLVNERGSVTLQELKDYFNASDSTIRRDITALSNKGLITKVFGGAVAVENVVSNELTVAQKENVNVDEKKKIAEYAASLIESNDCVFIDAGTTTGYMLDFITCKDAIYVTNAISHANKLAKKGLKAILIGGELKGVTEAIVGADAILNIQRYHFSIGFFGANGVNVKTGFTTPDINEAIIKETALRNTQRGKRYVLCDFAKIEQISSVTFAELSDAKLITDKKGARKSIMEHGDAVFV